MEYGKDNDRARTNDELRADIEKGVNEVRKGASAYGQMKELMGRRELEQLQNGQKAEDAVASALALAMENKGRVPKVATEYLNRQFGFDGKTSGIVDGGIDPNTGDFGFVFAERDNAGNMQYRKQMMPSQMQLGLMEGYPSLFSADAVKAHRDKMLTRFAPGELDAYSKVAQLARDRRNNRIAELKYGASAYGRGAGRSLFKNGGAGDGLKETVSALSQMQSYLEKAGPGMSDEQRQKLQQAIDAGFAGLASRFMPQSTQGGGQGGGQPAEAAFPDGMKEGDEQEHNGKTYVLGRKDGKPMWLLKK